MRNEEKNTAESENHASINIERKTFADFLKSRYVLIISVTVLTLLVFLLTFFASKELIGRLTYETREVAEVDTVLYYVVGHGMAEGLVPYSEMYENKPPMIFILAYLSYKWTGGFYLCNVFTVLAFITILLCPLIYVAIILIKQKKGLFYSGLVALFMYSASIYLTIYAESHAGEVQSEAFGAACAEIYLTLLGLTDTSKCRFYSPKIIFAGIFLGFAVMFKEPFFIVAVTSALFFMKNKKDYLYKLALPLAVGGCTGVIILLSARCFIPYFTIYISHMFGEQLVTDESPFTRMWRINKLYTNLGDFSFALVTLVIISLAADWAFDVFADYSEVTWKNCVYKILSSFKVPLALLNASFAVGLGGQYFAHHYVFALPFYFALFAKFASVLLSLTSEQVGKVDQINSKLPEEIRKNVFSLGLSLILLPTIVFSAVGFHQRDEYKASEATPAKVAACHKDAEWLDSLLDAAQQKNYLWIGFNGIVPIMYTEHLPLGPVFAQDSLNFTKDTGFFPESFLKELAEANVLVYARNNTDAIAIDVFATVIDDFSSKTPEGLEEVMSNKPDDYDNYYWRLYFRKSAFTFA
jgi:hypothetical protein